MQAHSKVSASAFAFFRPFSGVLPIGASLFLFTVSSATAADWNTAIGGRPERTSLSSELGPSAPSILWQGSTPAQLPGPPAISDDLVVSSRTESFSDIVSSTWIVAQELASGASRWRVQVPISFPDSWSTQVGGIRDGQVYASRASNGSNSEYLYALNARDGSILWRSVNLIDQMSIADSLAFAANGDIIHGNFRSLTRIDHSTGATVWSTPRLCPTSNGCAAALLGDRVYAWDVIDSAGELMLMITVFDAANGARLYSSFPLAHGIVTIDQITPLVGPDATVYAPLANNTPSDAFIALQDTGTALTEKWRIPMGYTPFASFGVGPDGSVYSYSRNNEVLRLDPTTGGVLNRSFPIPHDAAAFQPRIAIDGNGTVFLGNGGVSTAFLYSFDADLTLRWSERIPSVTGPAIGQGGILVVLGSGTDARAYQTP